MNSAEQTPEQTSWALEVDKLEVVYKRAITALQGVTMRVPAGGIVGVLGTNGAGKSTLLRAITGFHGLDDARVTEGSVRYLGWELANTEPHRITALGLALVPEREKVFPNLTVAENLAVPMPSSLGRADGRRLETEVYGYFPRLADLRQRTAGLLSGGERQMLAIASALMCRPRLLLVDELSLGLAPVVVSELMQKLLDIRKALNLTMVIVEQSASVALDVVDYGYVLENGRVVLDGDAARLRDHPDIREFYLGHGAGQARRSYRDVKQYRRNRRWYG
jgi:branched-chain amino acid transport system ATP-binding protein